MNNSWHFNDTSIRDILMRAKGINVEEEVKKELFKTIKAKEKLMENNFIKFRYDELPNLEVSKQNLLLKKRIANAL